MGRLLQVQDKENGPEDAGEGEERLFLVESSLAGDTCACGFGWGANQ